MVKTAMEFIAKISDKKKKIFIKRIAEKTGINEELLIKETYKSAAKGETRTDKTKPSLILIMI